MLFNLFKKDPETIIENLMVIVFQENTPLERWLSNLKTENKLELKFFSLCYCLLFLDDYKLIKLNEDTLELFFVKSYSKIKNIYATLSLEDYIGILSDRLEKYYKEIPLVRQQRLNIKPHFPNYFYNYVMNYPLKIKSSVNQYQNEEWDFDELLDMYAHQVNDLQKELKKLL
jgi:hypothetical protein